MFVNVREILRTTHDSCTINQVVVDRNIKPVMRICKKANWMLGSLPIPLLWTRKTKRSANKGEMQSGLIR